MPNIDQLLQRIDSAFETKEASLQAFQAEQLEAHHGREQRLEQFEQKLTQLKEVWRPRLELLSQRFGQKVNVTPSITPGRRDARFRFNSELAHIDLRFSVMTDQDVRNVIFCYDLQILPILMKFESHSEIEFPLDGIDTPKLEQWMDDRIVSFVNTYLSLHENRLYLKGHLVRDPIANVEFPKYAAAATAEVGGKTFYFISEETRQKFLEKK